MDPRLNGYSLLTVIIGPLALFVGIVIGGNVPELKVGLLVEFAVACGTIGAVVVALWQTHGQRRETTSRVYYEKAESTLRVAVEDFGRNSLNSGAPLNDRRHWLNFARALKSAQELAAKMQIRELKEIWSQTENYWRGRVYDMLNPLWASLPADYYGYTLEAERHKNIAQAPGERAPLSEPSLVAVYRWIEWPKELPDNLDRNTRFSDEEIDKMESFGPRGLAEFLRIQRAMRSPASARPGAAIG
jgi:hypothetical protein